MLSREPKEKDNEEETPRGEEIKIGPTLTDTKEKIMNQLNELERKSQEKYFGMPIVERTKLSVCYHMYTGQDTRTKKDGIDSNIKRWEDFKDSLNKEGIIFPKGFEEDELCIIYLIFIYYNGEKKLEEYMDESALGKNHPNIKALILELFNKVSKERHPKAEKKSTKTYGR